MIHPEFKRLKDYLADLILEHETLTSQTCPELKHEYLIHFGYVEFVLYRKDVQLSKLKRKLSLIQIQINNEEDIDIRLIDEIIKKEFKQYEENIQKQKEELVNAQNEDMGEFLSNEDSKKLKAIYKKCVFKLHPDLNEGVSNEDINLFIKMTDAFKKGDLKTLESLYYLISDDDGLDSASEIDKLHELIEDMELKIRKIKEDFPYNKKELLLDVKKRESYKKQLETLIIQYDEEIQAYNEKISKLI